jgi:hypothetical protein
MIHVLSFCLGSQLLGTKVQGIKSFSNQILKISLGSFQNMHIESELAFSI